MIEHLPTADADQLEFRFSGRITQADYDQIMIPNVEAALKDHDHIRILAIFDADFSGYDMSAAWADTTLGLSHWSGFDRIAVATETGWLRTSIRMAGAVLPCPVQVFGLADVDDARQQAIEAVIIRLGLWSGRCG